MNKGTKTFLWIMVPAVIAGGAFFLLNRNRKKKTTLQEDLKSPGTTTEGQVKPAKAVPNTVFPLQKGSNNSVVKKLQELIILTYGKSALPKYGADGDWGSETDAFIQNQFKILRIDDQKQLDTIIAVMESQQSMNKVKEMLPWLF